MQQNIADNKNKPDDTYRFRIFGAIKRRWFCLLFLAFYLTLLTADLRAVIRHIGIRDMSGEGSGFVLFLYFITYSSVLITLLRHSKGQDKREYRIIFIITIICSLLCFITEQTIFEMYK